MPDREACASITASARLNALWQPFTDDSVMNYPYRLPTSAWNASINMGVMARDLPLSLYARWTSSSGVGFCCDN